MFLIKVQNISSLKCPYFFFIPAGIVPQRSRISASALRKRVFGGCVWTDAVCVAADAGCVAAFAGCVLRIKLAGGKNLLFGVNNSLFRRI
jgi:hypothetical protein